MNGTGIALSPSLQSFSPPLGVAVYPCYWKRANEEPIFSPQEEGTAESWNDSWGDWQSLASSEQAPRYRAIAEMISRLRPKASVLDVGCGEAILSTICPGTQSTSELNHRRRLLSDLEQNVLVSEF